MKPTHLFIVLALLVVLWASLAAGQKPASEDAATQEEYAVYNAYLRTVKSKRELRLLVVVDHTGAPYHDENEGDWSKFAKENLAEMNPALMDTFLSRNQAAVGLENHFETSLNVVLVSQENLDDIFNKKSTGPDFGWDGFYRRFPDSQGFTRLSRVAFSPDGKQALMRVDTSCHWLCGAGYLIVLEKKEKEDVWTVKKGLMLWIS